MVPVQVVQFAPGLFCILLRVWPEFIEESFLHCAIVCHYVGGWWRDVLDRSFKVGDDGSLQKREMGCDALREVLCEVVLVGFVLVLFSLSGFVEKFLLSLALLLVLCCFQKCRRCKELCWGRRHAPAGYLDFVLDI
jgi:hypothetical protein